MDSDDDHMDEHSILCKQMEINGKKMDIEEKLKIQIDHVAEQLKNVEKHDIFNILKQLQEFKKNTDRSRKEWPYNCFVYNAFGYNIEDSEADELIADNRLKISQLQQVAEAYWQVAVDIKQNIDDHQDGVKIVDSVILDKYLDDISGYKVKWLNDKWISDEAVQRVSEIQRRITRLASPASKSSESAVKTMLVADDSDVKCAMRQPNNGQALLGKRKLTSNLQDSPREAAQNIPVVFFDLETTGYFGENGYIPEILCFAAVDSFNRKKTYKEIFHPNIDIQNGVNGFCRKYDKFAGREYLYLDGERVNGMEMKKGLESFIEWLDNNYDEPVLLVAHNCFKFDAKVLLLNMSKYDVGWSRNIWGFSDSLLASREFYNPPYTLKAMLEKFGVVKDQTTDALDYAQDVRTMVRRVAAQHFQSFTFQSFVRDKRWCKSLSSVEEDYGL